MKDYQLRGEQLRLIKFAQHLQCSEYLLELLLLYYCLLYTSDAADERSSVDLGGRRIIKKKKKEKIHELAKKNTIVQTAKKIR